VEYCPVEYPDRFNQDISNNKAVHIYFAQAIPLIAYIDESCLYLKEKKCRICEGVCKNDAIDLHQAPAKIDVNVAAIVLAPGYDVYDPAVKGDYGYGTLPNVVTSMDYERLMCATGPYEGEIRRASDKKHPRNIAWIQCVGSRRVTEGDNSYCSATCCTYTQKQVILTKDHDADTACTIFHNDIRSYGKGFEPFFQRAQQLPGTRFIRSYASIVGEDPETRNVIVKYATAEDDGVKEESFDMVVLSVGLNPPADSADLADTFGIALNEHGFCKTNPSNPMETSRPGIFVSGAFQGPMDIPESVFTASAAGSQCGQRLDYRRGKLTTAKVYPPERDVSEEEPRIGVFVCHCGTNIGRVVDVPSTVEYALTLPNVVFARNSCFRVRPIPSKRLPIRLRKKGSIGWLWRPAAPGPWSRCSGTPCVRRESINISTTWPISGSIAPGAIPRKKRPPPKRPRTSPACRWRGRPYWPFAGVRPAGQQSGAGGWRRSAGMTCALSIADQGHAVHLLEKDADLGGAARRIHTTLDGQDVQAYLRDLIHQVYRHPSIHVYTDAVITEATGYVGNFETRVTSERGLSTIEHGVAVIAVGAEEYKPAEYLYGQDDRVMTHLDLGERIARKDETVVNARSIVMIQCVGCRNEDRNYCSRVCCSHSIKNALKLKTINPEMDVTILFRDMRTYGFNEDYYREASSRDVRFIRWTPDDPPGVEAAKADGRSVLRVVVTDPILDQQLAIDADLLALAAAVVPSAGAGEISRFFKVPLGPDGFFQEAHVKLKPVEFAAAGVYLCGMAHYPKHIPEAVNQAYGAAGRALTLLSHDIVTVSGSVCAVTENKCMGCGACISVCTYGAIEFRKTRQGQKAIVNPVICKGDGLCNAVCPTGAIVLKHFTDEELLAQIDAAVPELTEAPE
jgi:heterodisulfide reductase subunit A